MVQDEYIRTNQCLQELLMSPPKIPLFVDSLEELVRLLVDGPSLAENSVLLVPDFRFPGFRTATLRIVKHPKAIGQFYSHAIPETRPR